MNSTHREAPSWKGTLVRLTVYVILLILIGMFIYRCVNPTHINHIVLMFRNPDDLRFVTTIELDGEVKWEQAASMGGSLGRKTSTTVHAMDVHSAWFGGTITLKGVDGTVIASVPISSPGRYGGALVILVDADGRSFAAWNQVPLEKP